MAKQPAPAPTRGFAPGGPGTDGRETTRPGLNHVKEAAAEVARDPRFHLEIEAGGVVIVRDEDNRTQTRLVPWVAIETGVGNLLLWHYWNMRGECRQEAARMGYAAMPPAPDGAKPAGRPRTVAETIQAWRADYESGLTSEDVPFDLHVRVLGMDEVLGNLEFYGGEA